MKTLITYFLFSLTLLPFSPATGQPATLFGQMEQDGPMKLELSFDLSRLEHSARTNAELPATVCFTDNQGKIQAWDAEVRARGRYRRRVCDFPPLRIDFSKDDLLAAGLQPFDDLKLVTHCMDSKAAQEAVLREYLAYQLYSQLSPRHLRTQLVEITYKDIVEGSESTYWGILIEDMDEMAARNGGEECEGCYSIQSSELDARNVQVHALFQYMIGNADWSMDMARNIKIIRPKDGGSYWVAPYDFDFSGLVNASYAVPDKELGQQEIGQRIYLGREMARTDLEQTIGYFQQKKESLLATVEGFSLLSKRSRRDIIRYLNTFYKELDNGQLFAYIPGAADSTAVNGK